MSTVVKWRGQTPQWRLFFFAVVTALIETAHSQSYFLTLSQKEYGLFGGGYEHNTEVKRPSGNHSITFINPNSNEEDDNNTTLVFVKSVVREKPSELSQTAMDVITIVWYVATFLALAAFFLLMACSDRRCNDTQTSSGSGNGSESPLPPPPTPAPSYSEFAPPSYETVVKVPPDSKGSVYVIECPADSTRIKEDAESGALMPNAPPVFDFYTISELHKPHTNSN